MPRSHDLKDVAARLKFTYEIKHLSKPAGESWTDFAIRESKNTDLVTQPLTAHKSEPMPPGNADPQLLAEYAREEENFDVCEPSRGRELCPHDAKAQGLSHLGSLND